MIVLPFSSTPSTPLSTNEAHRLHWASRRRRTDPWRDAAIVLARAERLADKVKGWPADVQVVIPVRDRRRRDPSNYVGTVVKAVIDGLVTAKVWPDDSPEWVRVIEPELRVGGNPEVRIWTRHVRAFAGGFDYASSSTERKAT